MAPCHYCTSSRSWLYTSSKSLVELNIDEHETTSMNITQMLSSLTCTHKVEVAGQPITTPLTSEAVQLQQASTAPAVQPSVAPATPKQDAARSPTAATRTQWKTPVTTDVQPPTGRTDVTPHQSGHVSKGPQRLIEHM